MLQGSSPVRRERHWQNQVTGTQMYPNDVMITTDEAGVLVRWILSLDAKPAAAKGKSP